MVFRWREPYNNIVLIYQYRSTLGCACQNFNFNLFRKFFVNNSLSDFFARKLFDQTKKNRPRERKRWKTIHIEISLKFDAIKNPMVFFLSFCFSCGNKLLALTEFSYLALKNSNIHVTDTTL